MKNLFKISQIRFVAFALLSFVFSNSGLFAQTSVCAGEEVCITLPTTLRGTLQWESSPTMTTWTNVSGATNDTLCITPTVNTYYRAKISEGTCDPLYSDTIEVIVNAIPVANAGADISMCLNSSDTIGGMPAASGGTSPYTYSWSPATGLSSVSIANPVTSTTVSMSYILTITDSNGCSSSDSVNVTINNPPVADAGPDSTITCADDIVLGGSPTGSGGSGALSYAWSPAAEILDSTLSNPLADPTDTTIFVVTVTDSLGCFSSDTVTVNVDGFAASGDSIFLYTGSVQYFIVPPCVDSVNIEVWGGEGGTGTSNLGGKGGYSAGKLGVNTGDTLRVYTGGRGQNHNFAGSIDYEALGGWNGGGMGGYDNSSQIQNGGGGGGGSDVRLSSDTTWTGRIIVAGGGGGSAGGSFSPADGGDGGGLIGLDGGFTYTALGGTGGTQSAGGVAGTLARNATDGVLGIGGRGSTNQNSWGSGGAGGGYYGGGGGTSTMDHGSGHAGAGGGGSSYIGGVVGGSTTAGLRSGNGEVKISW